MRHKKINARKGKAREVKKRRNEWGKEDPTHPLFVCLSTSLDLRIYRSFMPVFLILSTFCSICSAFPSCHDAGMHDRGRKEEGRKTKRKDGPARVSSNDFISRDQLRDTNEKTSEDVPLTLALLHAREILVPAPRRLGQARPRPGAILSTGLTRFHSGEWCLPSPDLTYVALHPHCYFAP